jgi:hypothetical protein
MSIWSCFEAASLFTTEQAKSQSGSKGSTVPIKADPYNIELKEAQSRHIRIKQKLPQPK